jgi:hypothetical protein
VRFSFLMQTAAAVSAFIEKMTAAHDLRGLHRQRSQYRRERGFLRLHVEQETPPRPDPELDKPTPQQEQPPPARVFLVGCERSGTTLLQSLLAAHSSIHSVPETHFMKRLFRTENIPKRYAGRWTWHKRALRNLHALRRNVQARVGWISRRHAAEAWRDVGGSPDKPSSYWKQQSARAHVRSFVDAMDTASQRAGKSVWIEKTPEHLFYIDLIKRHVPAARFIHIVRDGREVVASLNRLAQLYPQWHPFTDVTFAAERWNRAWRATKRWIGHPGHLVVRYETLMLAPRRTLASILQFLGCEPEHEVWKAYPQVACQLIRADEPWKAGNMQSVRDCRKFAKSFDLAAQSRIVDALDAPDWNTFSWLPRVIADCDAMDD